MERKNRPSRGGNKSRCARKGWLVGRARGQSLLEFALLLPMLLLLLVGAIDIGRYAYDAIMVSNAAHAGAAYGAQNTSTAGDLTGIARAVCHDFTGQTTCNLTVQTSPTTGSVLSVLCQCGSANLTVTKGYVCQCDSNGTIGSAINCTTGSCPAGELPGEIHSLWVTVQGTFTPLFNFPGFTQPVTLTKTAMLQIEAG